MGCQELWSARAFPTATQRDQLKRRKAQSTTNACRKAAFVGIQGLRADLSSTYTLSSCIHWAATSAGKRQRVGELSFVPIPAYQHDIWRPLRGQLLARHGATNMLRFKHFNSGAFRLMAIVGARLDQIDPGTHRRIKGLRLVTAFGLAAMLATVPGIAHGRGMLLGTLAAGFALWASVSEARSTRCESARDLTLLCLAAGVGAASFAILSRWLGPAWAELTLVFGSFCVGYLKRFGVLGGGIGS
jgi:hypothetical protein